MVDVLLFNVFNMGDNKSYLLDEPGNATRYDLFRIVFIVLVSNANTICKFLAIGVVLYTSHHWIELENKMEKDMLTIVFVHDCLHGNLYGIVGF